MIWAPCDKVCVEKDQYACRGDDRSHDFVLQEGGPGNEIVEAKCGNCGNLAVFLLEDWNAYGKEMDLRAQRNAGSRSGLTKYPRIEPHTGVLVNSRDDERRAMKAMGMHEAPHGVNEAFDDETCHNLKTKRLEIEQRKREITRRREALGRPAQLRRVK